MSQIRLIIADPCEEFAARAAAYLNGRHGIDVIARCTSGDKLISLVRSEKPDAVVMNTILEGLDGLCALKRLNQETERTAFIVCTEFYSEPIIRRARRFGARYFLCRPLLFSSLAECIVEAVSDMREDDIFTMPASIDAEIGEALIDMGIPRHCEGFELIRQAVRLALDEPSVTASMTGRLYPALARLTDSTPSRAERNIRTAINHAYMHGALPGARRPTNREFILSVIMSIRRDPHK